MRSFLGLPRDDPDAARLRVFFFFSSVVAALSVDANGSVEASPDVAVASACCFLVLRDRGLAAVDRFRDAAVPFFFGEAFLVEVRRLRLRGGGLRLRLRLSARDR